MIEGLVSTIVPVHNRPAQLLEAVTSVLAQDWPDMEVIIVDDGSTDGTRSVAESLAAQHPSVVRVLAQANAGPGAARERGRLAARGEFIQYLDSDDVLLPGKFSAQVSLLRAHRESDVAYGMTRFRRADGSVLAQPWKGSGERRATMFPAFLLDRWWDTSTPLYRRAICDRAGPWTNLLLEEDWEYDCRIAALGGRLVWADRFVCEVRDHTGPRLCQSDAEHPARLAHRAQSRRLIYAHARRAGIDSQWPEMQLFSRSAFMLARRCGAAGLVPEARDLLRLAEEAAGKDGARDVRVYAAAAAVFGFRWTGRASAWLDRMRESHA